MVKKPDKKAVSLVLFILQVPNSAIKECRNYTDFSGKDFTNPMKKEEDRKTFPPMLAAK